MRRLDRESHLARPMAVFLGCALCLGTLTHPCTARTLIKDISRVKGQEENVLHGMGLVVGLRGTGDSGDYLPAMRALARSMELMGNPLSKADLSRGRGRRSVGGLLELKDTKNVALVWVTAVVPSTGARRGDKIDCSVSAISAQSLKGGRLTFAALQGPGVGDSRVYAISEGRIHLDDSSHPTEAKIHQGCRLEEDFFHVFQKGGKFTLVLDEHHADFQLAADLAETVNHHMKYARQTSGEESFLAKAIDPANVEVEIPSIYISDPVPFVSQVLSLPIYEPQTEARVVINERAGSIVIGDGVEIGPVVVSHKNVVVESGDPSSTSRFVPMESSGKNSPKLKSLVEALSALKVPTKDVIEIIKGIQRNGKLHGRLIIQ